MDDKDTSAADMQWATDWLDAVASGANTMSQRTVSSITRRAGSLDAVKALAHARGVHLLLLEDDKGTPIVAASTRAFTVIC